MADLPKIYLTKDEFKNLPEYSMSWPTGPREGFEFKRHVWSFKINGKILHWYRLPEEAELIDDDWFYYKYKVDPKDPSQLIARPMEIVIAGSREIDKNIARFMERGKNAN